MLLEKSVFELCQQTGLPSSKVKAAVYDWATPLMRKGVIIHLQIKRWRAQTSLDASNIYIETDFLDEFMKEYLSLGRKFLLPKRVINEMNNVENGARANLKNNSFDTPWGHFVPSTMFVQWDLENDKIKNIFYELRDRLTDEFDDLKSETILEYEKYCDHLQSKAKITDPDSIRNFKSNFIDEINNSFISKEDFYGSFKYDYLASYIPLPSMIEEDALAAKKIQGKKELVEIEVEMQKRVLQKAEEKKTQNMESFIEATAGKMRQLIVDVLSDVKTGYYMNKSKPSSESTKKKLLEMIKQVRNMNFYDDQQIEKAIDNLQVKIEKDAEYRSDQEIFEKVQELERAAKSGISDLIYGSMNMAEI